ncbi:MBL fold metallo-hydrolase [Microbulbifer sp. 2304DJ12-6]|uniref:MBL fold metallo-hydrolase n=1 Tax=Microbulbifer sp. 2304DJ12-6 TaxID=3233340 RepID=UPI0039AF02E1
MKIPAYISHTILDPKLKVLLNSILLIVIVVFQTESLATTAMVSVISVSENVYILNSDTQGTNIGLLNTNEGLVLIDPMPGDEHLDALNAVIEEKFIKPVKYILNTHNHSDHAGGNEYFIKRGSMLLESTMELPEIGSIVVNSHTAKDKIFFHAKSNSIFVGDVYDTSWHPTFYAGGVSGFMHAIEQILSLGDEKSIIIPGHGKPANKAGLRAFRNNTLKWITKVKELKQKGMTVIEMKNNSQLNTILEQFNSEDKANFLPEKALIRFIERTLVVIKGDV